MWKCLHVACAVTMFWVAAQVKTESVVAFCHN